MNWNDSVKTVEQAQAGRSLLGGVCWNGVTCCFRAEIQVAPCLGAWIETAIMSLILNFSFIVAPCLGAWIETTFTFISILYCRPLYESVNWNKNSCTVSAVKSCRFLLRSVCWNQRTESDFCLLKIAPYVENVLKKSIVDSLYNVGSRSLPGSVCWNGDTITFLNLGWVEIYL